MRKPLNTNSFIKLGQACGPVQSTSRVCHSGKHTRALKSKMCTPAGTRTRVSRVKAGYSNHLDHKG